MPQPQLSNAAYSKRPHFAPLQAVTDRIAHCISSSETRRLVETALRMGRLEPVAVELAESSFSLRGLSHCSGIVYDLYPWDITATLHLEGLRHRFPDLLILLYAPARAGIARLLSLCAHTSGVHAELQQGCSTREAERLRELVTGMLDDGPRLRLLRMIQAALPPMRDTVWRFTELALRLMGRSRLTVGGLASGLGISERTLERSWCETSVPAPKELLEWITLLFVGLLSAQSGFSVASAARGLGIDTQALYRLRHRLLSTDLRQGRDDFEVVFLAFADRCRVRTRPTARISD